MKITLRQPPKNRSQRFAQAFGAVGAAVGSLPVTVRSGSRKPSGPDAAAVAKIAGPAALALVAAGALLKRRAGGTSPSSPAAQSTTPASSAPVSSPASVPPAQTAADPDAELAARTSATNGATEES